MTVGGGLSTEEEEVGAAPLPRVPTGGGSGLAPRGAPSLPPSSIPGAGGLPGLPAVWLAPKEGCLPGDARGTPGERVLGLAVLGRRGSEEKVGVGELGKQEATQSCQTPGQRQGRARLDSALLTFPPRRVAGTPRHPAPCQTRHPTSSLQQPVSLRTLRPRAEAELA